MYKQVYILLTCIYIQYWCLLCCMYFHVVQRSSIVQVQSQYSMLHNTYLLTLLNIWFVFVSESPINGNRNINNTASSPISEKIEVSVPIQPQQSPPTFSSALEERNSYQSVFANSLTNGGGNRNNGVQQPQYSEIHKTPPSPTTVPLM